MQSTQNILEKISNTIINPAIVFLVALAVLLFLYGVFEYFKDSDNEKSRETGARHILWGIIGLFIMVSAIAIIEFIRSAFGI